MKFKPLTTVFLCIQFACAISSPVFASARAPAMDMAGFEASSGWAKLDLRSREAWQSATRAGDTTKRLDCLMKTKETLSDGDKAILKSAGFAYRTIVGTIITGNVTAKDLPAVANLDFVQAMELSVPMSIKKGGR